MNMKLFCNKTIIRHLGRMANLAKYTQYRNFSLSLKNNLGTFIVFDHQKSKQFVIKFPYGDYETLYVSYDHEMDFQVLEALAKIAYFYNVNDFRSALSYIDNLNQIRPDWVKYWPSYRVLITFFSLLQKHKYYPYIIHYYSIYEKQGIVLSGKLFQQILISYINTKNYEKAAEFLKNNHDIKVSDDFIPLIFESIFKSTPLPVVVNIISNLIKIIPINIKLREIVVDSFIAYICKIPFTKCIKNKDINELLQSNDFQYVILLLEIIRSQRYELSTEQTKRLMSWFNNYFKDKVVLKLSVIYGENMSKCFFCGYKMEKIPKPVNGTIFKDALIEVMENIKKIIYTSNQQIQTEFECFDIWVKRNFPLYSIIDYSNLRETPLYKKSLIRVNPFNNAYSDVKLWEEYSQFWYPLINYCPNHLKIGCILPVFYSQEIRFLLKNKNFVCFNSRFLTEDILCIYACAYTYLKLMEGEKEKELIPRIITHDKFENFHELAPKNSNIFKRWLFQVRGFIKIENDKYRFTSHTYDRLAQKDEESMHFPVKGGNWLCIKFKI